MNIRHITNAPDGIVRIWTDGAWEDSATRKAAKSAAAKVAHSLVGAPQNVRPGKVEGKAGTLADYAPLSRKAKQADPHEAAAQAAYDAAVSAPNVAALQAQLDEILAQLAEAQGAPEPKQADTFRERVIVPRAERRAAAKCATCVDYGRVRKTPDKRGRFTFRTANGAAGALSWKPCPDCAKGKAEAKRSA